jgi:O-Antigen ligase
MEPPIPQPFRHGPTVSQLNPARASWVTTIPWTLIAVVGGGVLILQSSNSLDPMKVGYLTVVLLIVLKSGYRTWQMRRSAALRQFQPWMVVTAAWTLLIVLSIPVSLAHGANPVDWLRDSAAYGLFAICPVLAVDAARSTTRRFVIVLTAAVSTFAAASFAVFWLTRRQIIVLPISHLGLPSEVLGGTMVALGTVMMVKGDSNRGLWGALAGISLGLFFVTATRSSLLLLVVPIVVLIFARVSLRAAARVFLVEVGTAALLVLVTQTALVAANLAIQPASTPVAASPTPIETEVAAGPSGHSPGPATSAPSTTRPGVLGQRVSSIGSLLSSPGSDPSLATRVRETKVAWGSFLDSPVVGMGPGYLFTWLDASGSKASNYTLDTPLLELAKFGLIGVGVILLTIVVLVRTVARIATPEPNVEYLVLVGFASVVLVVGLLGSPFEDKGLGLATALVLTIVAISAAPRSQSDEVPTPQGGLE